MVSASRIMMMVFAAVVVLVCACQGFRSPTHDEIFGRQPPRTLPPNRPRFRRDIPHTEHQHVRHARSFRGGHTVPTGTLQQVPPPRFSNTGGHFGNRNFG